MAQQNDQSMADEPTGTRNNYLNNVLDGGYQGNVSKKVSSSASHVLHESFLIGCADRHARRHPSRLQQPARTNGDAKRTNWATAFIESRLTAEIVASGHRWAGSCGWG